MSDELEELMNRRQDAPPPDDKPEPGAADEPVPPDVADAVEPDE